MKKILSLMITFILLISSVVSVFAASSYTKSPAVQDVPQISNVEAIPDPEAAAPAPELIIKEVKDGEITFYTNDGNGPCVEDCAVTMKVTPYAERQTIEDISCKVTDGTSSTGEVSAEERLLYARTNEKNGTDNFADDGFALFRKVISDAASEGLQGAKEANNTIKDKDMVIVSLFDVSVWCENPEQHDLSQHHCIHTIRCDFADSEMSALLDNFVALMHYNRAGEWEYIPAKVYEDPVTKNDVVEFSVDCENLSPFTIVAYNKESSGKNVPVSPQTGQNPHAGYLALSVLFALAAAACFECYRKRSR